MGRPSTFVYYVLGYFLCLELALVAAMLYWPDFLDNMGAVRALARPLPVLGALLGEIEQTGIVGYVAGQHFFKGCSTLGCAAAVLFSVGAVAGEVHRGTLEIVLARPQSRTRILLERYVVGALAMALPIYASSATIPRLAEHIGESIGYEGMMIGSTHQTIFLMMIYSATFFLSTIGSNPMRIALGMLLVSTSCFALYMIKVLSQYSLFRLADIPDFVRIEQERSLDWSTCGPMLGVSAVLLALSFVAFRRRVP